MLYLPGCAVDRRLVIGGGANAAHTISNLPPELRPLTPNGLTRSGKPGWSGRIYGGVPVRVPGPFVMAIGENFQGEILAIQNGLPLI